MITSSNYGLLIAAVPFGHHNQSKHLEKQMKTKNDDKSRLSMLGRAWVLYTCIQPASSDKYENTEW